MMAVMRQQGAGERRSSIVSPRGGRARSEFDQKVLDIRRTARVVAGGRRFSFRAAVVIGDRAGRVGFGVGKGSAVADAVDKGALHARKAIIRVPVTNGKSIPHEVAAKFSAARVVLKPAPEGRGIVAGGPVRTIADLAGIKNLSAKILGRTANKLNNAKAVIEALKKLKKQESRSKNQGEKEGSATGDS